MRKMRKMLMAGILLLLMAACTGGPEYVVQDNVVVYSYWTFSFGRLNDTLPGADPSTFKAVNSWLGHDSERVYYENRLVPDVDVATLKAERRPLFRDKNDYYYETTPMRVADLSSFKILKWFEDDFWARDSRYAYFDTLCIRDVDLASFEIMNMMVARDKKQVYYFGRVLPGADPATFEPMGNSVYYRDKSHVWYYDELMPDADLATFTVDGLSHAHDKYGPFKNGKRDTVETEP